jgi:hypothetical protein
MLAEENLAVFVFQEPPRNASERLAATKLEFASLLK